MQRCRRLIYISNDENPPVISHQLRFFPRPEVNSISDQSTCLSRLHYPIHSVFACFRMLGSELCARIVDVEQKRVILTVVLTVILTVILTVTLTVILTVIQPTRPAKQDLSPMSRACWRNALVLSRQPVVATCLTYRASIGPYLMWFVVEGASPHSSPAVRERTRRSLGQASDVGECRLRCGSNLGKTLVKKFPASRNTSRLKSRLHVKSNALLALNSSALQRVILLVYRL
jgi:hypothetical protein